MKLASWSACQCVCGVWMVFSSGDIPLYRRCCFRGQHKRSPRPLNKTTATRRRRRRSKRKSFALWWWLTLAFDLLASSIEDPSSGNRWPPAVYRCSLFFFFFSSKMFCRPPCVRLQSRGLTSELFLKVPNTQTGWVGQIGGHSIGSWLITSSFFVCARGCLDIPRRNKKCSRRRKGRGTQEFGP